VDYPQYVAEYRQEHVDPGLLAGDVSFTQTLKASPTARLISKPWLGYILS